MRTVKATIPAYIVSQFTTLDQLFKKSDREAINELEFYDNGAGTFPPSWILAGTAEIVVTLREETELIHGKIDSLRAELKQTQADAEVKCNEIREKINNLLALEYKP